jgi:uncharacterized damage-inducible protein DinB
MSLAKNFKMMSLYNQRINTQLLGCCLNLSNEVLNKDTNSFFPSIIAYWNHLLFGDLILLSRIASNDIAQLNDQALSIFPSPKSPQDIYHTQIKELAKLREQVDVVIVDYCANLTDEACGKLITYTTTEGELITKVVADITQHLFNHQTHHRGQLTCVLSQSGVNYGCMDLPVIVPEGSS